jgi:hypothetical protein
MNTNQAYPTPMQGFQGKTSINDTQFSTPINLTLNRSSITAGSGHEELIVITELITAGSIREYLRKITAPRIKVIKKWCLKMIEGLSHLHQ